MCLSIYLLKVFIFVSDYVLALLVTWHIFGEDSAAELRQFTKMAITGWKRVSSWEIIFMDF